MRSPRTIMESNMKLSRVLAKSNRKVMILLGACAFLAQPLWFAGCDQNLKNNLLAGIEVSLIGLVNTFISAFFQSLSTPVSTSQPVVQAIIEHLPKFA